MSDIPDRENLESMSRTDIQKLCKNNNIKANMRTDEMINALCDLVNGKDVPRPHRPVSERPPSQPPPRSRLSSVQSVTSKAATEATTKKKTLQPAESNTDAESVAEIPVSAPTTRRKAKDIQVHLGKGRPAAAGGSGARNVTKVISRGAGRKARASATLREEPIPEEDEDVGAADAPKAEVTQATRPSSVLPHSQGSPSSNIPDQQPSQLPTPAPSQPSYSFPSAQLSALEMRVAQLESPNLVARILQIEASIAEMPTLVASLAQISDLQVEMKRLAATNKTIEGDVAQWTKAHAELKARMNDLEAKLEELAVENGALKERVAGLEVKLRDHGGDSSTGSVIIHSPKSQKDLMSGKSAETEPRGDNASIPPSKQPLVPADPSPSQPTLGKRTRSDTSDASFTADCSMRKQGEDADLEAIHRVTRPQRKKARLDLNSDEDNGAVSFFNRGRGGPSSTSTPRHRPSDSPPGFFTAGRPAPTPLTRKDDMDVYLRLDPEESAEDERNESEMNAVVGPSSRRTSSPVDAEAGPRTPRSKGVATSGLGGASEAELPRGQADPLHDPGFFGGPLPVYYTQGPELPYPLQPTTPPNAQDILERSAQFATPILGEPWKYHVTVNPANITQSAEGAAPTTSGDSHTTATSDPHAPSTSSMAGPPGSPVDYTFRAGGRRERNDKYNPYFTPQRGPSARYRTGLTPTRGFSMSLKSPAKMMKDGADGATAIAPIAEDVDEDGVERSPPQLRTLYGTELEGDTRFGDYGRDLGRFDWGKYLPR